MRIKCYVLHTIFPRKPFAIASGSCTYDYTVFVSSSQKHAHHTPHRHCFVPCRRSCAHLSQPVNPLSRRAAGISTLILTMRNMFRGHRTARRLSFGGSHFPRGCSNHTWSLAETLPDNPPRSVLERCFSKTAHDSFDGHTKEFNMAARWGSVKDSTS